MRLVRVFSALVGAVSCFAVASAQEPDPVPAKKSDVPAQTQAPAQAAAPKGVSETQKGRGQLFVKESTWDFGYVAQDVKISHEFTLQNIGDDTLFIERIKPT